MVRPIMKDVMFLSQKSDPAGENDKQVIEDLRDTLEAHRDGCVGMAANMIGYKKRIIIVSLGFADVVMLLKEQEMEQCKCYRKTRDFRGERVISGNENGRK